MDGESQPFVVHQDTGYSGQLLLKQPGNPSQVRLEIWCFRVHEMHTPTADLQSVIARIDETWDADHGHQVIKTPATDHANYEPVHLVQGRQRMACFSRQSCDLRSGGDGSEGTVVIEQQ